MAGAGAEPGARAEAMDERPPQGLGAMTALREPRGPETPDAPAGPLAWLRKD